MENSKGYKAFDSSLTKFLVEYPNPSELDWFKLDDIEIKKLTVPDKEFNKKIISVYGASTWKQKIKNEIIGTLIFVFGRYIRKDFYSKSQYDETKDYFFTLLFEKPDGKIVSAKYTITQREYKIWLISMFEKEGHLNNSFEVQKRASILKNIYEVAENKVNSEAKIIKKNNTELEDLF